MKYKVVIEPPAEEDIERAFLWIAEESRVNAVTWYRNLVEALASLETFPERSPLASENDAFEEEIRQLLFGKKRNVYRILFTIQDKRIHILHIRHCARAYLEP